jgi:hypothetical protein
VRERENLKKKKMGEGEEEWERRRGRVRERMSKEKTSNGEGEEQWERGRIIKSQNKIKWKRKRIEAI